MIGSLAVEDEVRPESAEAVKALHELGVRVAMIPGDSRTVAVSVVRKLGIDDIAAQVLPADKASAVQRFRAEGKEVAMVGGGVNDAPALAIARMSELQSAPARMWQWSLLELFSCAVTRATLCVRSNCRGPHTGKCCKISCGQLSIT